jgi:hypothetical protein
MHDVKSIHKNTLKSINSFFLFFCLFLSFFSLPGVQPFILTVDLIRYLPFSSLSTGSRCYQEAQTPPPLRRLPATAVALPQPQPAMLLLHHESTR